MLHSEGHCISLRATPEGSKRGHPMEIATSEVLHVPQERWGDLGVISLEKRLPDTAVFKLKDEVQGKETACLVFL